ncbi:unnamed protein product [Auanema sp. JU1783]|nr:unnamed protein product [Auanema sp. JU1783]
MFRRPASDDSDDDIDSRVVKAKLIPQKYAKKLGADYGRGKDFVVGSAHSQKELAGSQQTRNDILGEKEALTEDERNKINAKILKAEMKGDMDAVRKLKRKLEGNEPAESSKKIKEVKMIERNKHGTIVPATSKTRDRSKHGEGSSRMNREYGKSQDLEDMIREEKTGTASDQLMLFANSVVVRS